jgi:3-dehydrosphinganine reductase
MRALSGWSGLAESLRADLLLYDIKVHLFLPATILSPGLENENKTKPAITKKLEEGDTPATPEECAKAMLKGLEKNQFFMTYEPVGHMARNCMATIPGNNPFLDAFWSIAGTVSSLLGYQVEIPHH